MARRTRIVPTDSPVGDMALSLRMLLGQSAASDDLSGGYGYTFRPKGAPGRRVRRRFVRRHGRQLIVHQIARLFGVPPRLLGRRHAQRLPLPRL